MVALSAFASMASMRMCDSMLVGLGQEFAVTTGEASAVIAYAAVAYGVLPIKTVGLCSQTLAHRLIRNGSILQKRPAV